VRSKEKCINYPCIFVIILYIRIKSQAEMIKAKRKAFKVEEEYLTKPVVVAKPTMQMENGKMIET
jgi:hypothetical protein